MLVRSGKTAPPWALVGLIVCCASTLADAGLVPPDEIAGLSSVTTLDGSAPLPLSLGRAVRGEGTSCGCPEAFTPARFNPETEFAGRTTSFMSCAPAAVETLINSGHLLPPVVRSQTPDIELLPLATGDGSVETASILRAITGTKGRIRGDYLTDFDETDRIGVHALTQAWFGIGLDAEANYWRRPIADGNIEPLWTGDLNLIYNIAPHPRFKFRTGAGANWIVDDGKPHAGYNFTHGLDVYLLWRGLAIGEIDWGKMDDDKLFRYRLALGLTFSLCEIYSGYESYKLGNERLDGWVNGVSFWY